MKRLLPLIALVLLLVAGLVYKVITNSTPLIGQAGQEKTPHVVDSTPAHGEVYAAQPVNVTINFNTDLSPESTISVKGNNHEWTDGPVRIEDAQTALKVDLKPGLPNGQYTVRYTACWLDRTCHDGRFTFSIDTTKQATYRDLRGRAEVAIDMTNLTFDTANIIISPETTVTWTNHDTVGHFVNTETHPEHTYFPPQNSREIPADGTFMTIFTTPGQYNYHCSAHYPGMVGSIIVKE